MPLLVVAATGLEMAAALGAPELKHGLEQGEPRDVGAYGRPVRALVCGLGVVNAALHLGLALSAGDIEGVLNFGVAGSFDVGAHPLCAARLVSAETWPEYGLLFSGVVAADGPALGFAQRGQGADAVYQRLETHPGGLARMGLDAGGFEAAESLTVSGVSADTKRAQALFSRYGAGLENMEGFALAYGARLAGLPFAELRAVSNRVGARPPQDWDLPGALAALGRAAQRLLASG